MLMLAPLTLADTAPTRNAHVAAETARATDGLQETQQEEQQEDAAGRRYQKLSTLGALLLGVVGLLWVRRHTAEL